MTGRIVAGNWESKFPIVFPDSSSFIKVANFGPLSIDFWFGERPLLTPLLLWLVGGGIREFVLAQTLLYFAATAILIYVLMRILHSNLSRIIAFVCIISIAIQSRYSLWNLLLLSESLGMSTALISIAAWLWYSHVQTKTSMALAWAATATWMLARDSNTAVTIFLVLSGLLALVCLKGRDSKNVISKYRIGLAAVLIVGCFAYLGQNISGRNDNPVMNNIGQRVLTNPQMLDWYESHGMPVNEALLERTGKSAFDDQWKMLVEPELEEFRSWSRESGQFRQLISFIRFAPHWIQESFQDLEGKLGYDYHDYDQFKVADKLPDGSWNGLGGPQSQFAALIWLILAMGSISLIWRDKNRIRAIVLSVLLLSCSIDYIVSWVGDSVEVNRHLVGCFFRTSIILAVVVACGANTKLSKSRTRTGRYATP